MTPTYRIIPYDEAHAVSERGEKVEYQQDDFPWEVVQFINTHNANCGCKFRILDPYAELKAAQAEGKVIQLKLTLSDSSWIDDSSPDWSIPPERYRVKPEPKPDELVFEPGKEYRTRGGYKTRVDAINAGGENPIHGAYLKDNCWIALSWRASGRYLLVSESDFDLIAPWTDTLAPYDNWDKVPAWAMWQAMDADGIWHWFRHTPKQTEKTERWFSDINVFGWTPPEFAPTNFTGTWEQSLQQRPTK